MFEKADLLNLYNPSFGQVLREKEKATSMYMYIADMQRITEIASVADTPPFFVCFARLHTIRNVNSQKNKK